MSDYSQQAEQEIWEGIAAADRPELVAVDPPRGLLEYATADPPYYVTWAPAGRSRGSETPARVFAVYQRARKVSIVGAGAGGIRIERITGHYRNRAELAARASRTAAALARPVQARMR